MITKFIGHRGAKGEAPENTLKGINFALEQSISGVEIDVHLSKDGKLMVIHDSTVDRTTNGSGNIIGKTYNELKKLDAGEGEQIPTLEEVMDLVKSFNADIFIELKAPDCEKEVINLIRKKDYVNHSIVKSFNHRWVKNTKALDSTIKAQCLMYALPINPIAIIKACNADGISLSTIHLDEELIIQCHQENFLVTTWNANNHRALKKFKEMGVDYVCTDFASLIPSMPL
ncbi:MAG: glycerophosphodiester phosphodiesterase [Epsilonproteobacteria bacterium]|nr:MAG: glycerophosphodiester phosphodiesterase [Campylobacterota bacterium]RLA66299.1 MAG: glycerophosphodiester phosphodiesterase [Campylobacterota bacterium]